MSNQEQGIRGKKNPLAFTSRKDAQRKRVGAYLIVTKNFLDNLLIEIVTKEAKKSDVKFLAYCLSNIRYLSAEKKTELIDDRDLEIDKNSIVDVDDICQVDYLRTHILKKTIRKGTGEARQRALEIFDIAINNQEFLKEMEAIQYYQNKGKQIKAIPELFLRYARQGKVTLAGFIFGIAYYSNRSISQKTKLLLLQNQPYSIINVSQMSEKLGILQKTLREGRDNLIKLELIQKTPLPFTPKEEGGEVYYYKTNKNNKTYRASPLLEDHYSICQDWIPKKRQEIYQGYLAKKEQRQKEQQKQAKANKQKESIVIQKELDELGKKLGIDITKEVQEAERQLIESGAFMDKKDRTEIYRLTINNIKLKYEQTDTQSGLAK
jgi:predicted ArsR family transcriptional regulator